MFPASAGRIGALLVTALAAAQVSYSQSAICAACHPAIWETYRRTGMAQSFYRPTTASTFVTGRPYYHKPSDTYFEVIVRDGRYFERQYQLGFDGTPTDSFEKQIDYVMGSGNHARTYLHRTEQDTLIELPLGWYSENGGVWAMNPGYDRSDHQGFERRIPYDCMFCHNAYPEIPLANQSPRSTPVVSNIPEGIDCQRCHGSGDRHIELARKGVAALEIRNAIVNPARLTPDRQLEVCMQCHLETTSSPLPASIVRYERGPFSYLPGQPLADFMLHFDHAPGQGFDGKFEITGSAYRLRQSQCFRQSAGALTCTTCHNPHESAQSKEHYNAVCRKCHAASLVKLTADARHTPMADCIRCHMPKRRTDDVPHAVMTDHFIQRQAPAEQTHTQTTPYRGEVALYYPPSTTKREDELYLAIAQVSQSSNLTESIERLTAAIAKYKPAQAEYYLQLGDALTNAGRYNDALRQYDQALLKEPNSVAVLERMAVCLSLLKQYARAEEVLKRAQSITPEAPAWVQLALIEQAQSKTTDAIAALRKALQADPEMPEALNSLATIWLDQGDTAQAEPALRNALRIRPNYAVARNNLANLLSSTDRFAEARYQYEAALRYRQNYNGARYNYALMLTRTNRPDEARAQLEAILKTDPRDAAAHHFLGTILAAKGQTGPAIEHYRQALNIDPEFSRANLDLGIALSNSTDPDAAVLYLRKAAQSTDPAVAAAARKHLERLGSHPSPQQ